MQAGIGPRKNLLHLPRQGREYALQMLCDLHARGSIAIAQLAVEVFPRLCQNRQGLRSWRSIVPPHRIDYFLRTGQSFGQHHEITSNPRASPLGESNFTFTERPTARVMLLPG